MIRWHDKKRVYVCNWAVGITKGKYTDDPNKVTCKNCKKRMYLPKEHTIEKTGKQRMAKYYEFNEEGKTIKEIMLDYGIYFNVKGDLVLNIDMDDKRKTIKSAIDIPIKELFDCFKKHTKFQEKEYLKREEAWHLSHP